MVYEWVEYGMLDGVDGKGVVTPDHDVYGCPHECGDACGHFSPDSTTGNFYPGTIAGKYRSRERSTHRNGGV